MASEIAIVETVYKTVDGKLYEDRKDAEKHRHQLDMSLSIKQWVLDNLGPDDDCEDIEIKKHGPLWEIEQDNEVSLLQFAETIQRNGAELVEILNTPIKPLGKLR